MKYFIHNHCFLLSVCYKYIYLGERYMEQTLKNAENLGRPHSPGKWNDTGLAMFGGHTLKLNNFKLFWPDLWQ